MQIKRFFVYASKLGELELQSPPKVFNVIDVIVAMSKFIVAMYGSIVLFIAKISQIIRSFKAIGIHNFS